MEPITFNQAIEFLQTHFPDGVVIITLGGRAVHFVQATPNGEHIEIDNRYLYTNEHWNLVMQRVAELPQNERAMSSRYQYPGGNNVGWDAYRGVGHGILHRNYTPYVPAVLRFVINHELYGNA